MDDTEYRAMSTSQNIANEIESEISDDDDVYCADIFDEISDYVRFEKNGVVKLIDLYRLLYGDNATTEETYLRSDGKNKMTEIMKTWIGLHDDRQVRLRENGDKCDVVVEGIALLQ